MSDITETIEEAKKIAGTKNCVVVSGGEDMLLLDFDTTEGVRQFLNMRSKLNELFKIASEEWWWSSSGAPNVHAIIYFQACENYQLTAAERVALQAAVGSDGWREMFAVRRLKLKVSEPSLLFRPMASKIFNSYDALLADSIGHPDLPF